MKLQSKFTIVMVIAVVLLIGSITHITNKTTSAVEANVATLTNEIDVAESALADLRIAFLVEVRATEERANDFMTAEGALEEIHENEEVIEENIKILKGTAGVLTIENIATLEKLIAEEGEVREAVFKLKAESGAIGLTEEVHEELEGFDEIVENIADLQSEVAANIAVVKAEHIANLHEATNTAAGKILTVGLIAIVVIALLMFIAISKMIIAPIRNLQGVANAIAGGNLEKEFSADSNDEIGQLALSLDKMRLQLKVVVEDYSEQVSSK